MVRANKYLSIVWVPYLVIGLASALVWGHTVKYEFVWDDRQFIQELDSIRSLKNIPTMFYSLEAQSSYPEGFKLFRPLRTAHYALLYAITGHEAPQPWAFHLANILWHTGAAMLLFLTTLLLLGKLLPVQPPERLRWLSLWAALAFAIHPVISEVVCWAKSLDDAMAAVFTLAALRTLLKWDGGRAGYLLGVFWFLLAVYSKISAVPFALAAFFIFWSVLKFPLRKSCWLSSGFLMVALVFMSHRHWVIGQSSQTAPISGTYWQTLLDMFPVVPKYLRLLCGAPPFLIDYSFMPGHWGLLSGPVLLGLALLAVAGLVAVRALWKPENELLGFGLAWVGLFLLPVSNLLPMMQYMAERFLYLPLIGWLWVMVLLLNRLGWAGLPPASAGALPGERLPVGNPEGEPDACPTRGWFPASTATSMLAALLVLVWAAVAWNRSFIWQDEVTLFVQSSQQGPKTQRVQDNAVAAIFELPHVRAMFQMDRRQRALRVVNNLPAEQRETVRKTLAEAHDLFPEDAVVSSALGILWALGGDHKQALPFFEAAAQSHPDNPRYWVNLGTTYLELQEWPKAEAALSKALALQPNQLDALRASSRLWWQQQNYPAALKVLHQLKRLEPGQTEHDHWIQEAEAKLKSQLN